MKIRIGASFVVSKMAEKSYKTGKKEGRKE